MTTFRQHALGLAVLGALSLPLQLHAQTLDINGLTLDSVSGNTLGTLSGKESMDDFVKLQKQLVFSVLSHLGIDVDKLSPQIREQLNKPLTGNLAAFEAFAKGLDLADKGQFADAAASFEAAAKMDPGFSLAAGMALLMPPVNVGDDPKALAQALESIRKASQEEGLFKANEQLALIEQEQSGGGGGDLNDLGISEDQDPLGPEPLMLDPMSLVRNGPERNGGEGGNGGNRGNPPDGGTQPRDSLTFPLADLENNHASDDLNRDTIPSQTVFQGFSAGIVRIQDCSDGCTTLAADVVTGASQGNATFTPHADVNKMDGSVSVAGDYLAATSTPTASVSLFETSSYTTALDNFYITRGEFTNDSQYIYSDQNAQGQYQYASWGEWGSTVVNAVSDITTESFGYWVAGELTPGAAIPNSGSASYSGRVIGDALDTGGDSRHVAGSMSMTVDFLDRRVAGSFSNLDYVGGAPGTWLNTATFNQSNTWTPGSNGFQLNMDVTGNVSSGKMNGAFYGPAAQEVGGIWRINHINGDKGVGVFIGTSASQ